MKKTILGTLVAVAMSTTSVMAESVKIGAPAWTGAQAIAHLIQEIVVSKMGSEAELVPGDNAAIFAAMDSTAVGLLDGLRRQGLRAPDDLAIVGFDDLEIAKVNNLTTIRQPLYESGKEGIRYLLKILTTNDPLPAERIVLPLTLIERSTT